MPPEPSQDVARPEGGVPGFRVKCEAEVVGPQEFYQQSYVPDPFEQERRPGERPQGLGSVTGLLRIGKSAERAWRTRLGLSRSAATGRSQGR